MRSVFGKKITILEWHTAVLPSLCKRVWVGVGCSSKVVATFNHVGGSFNLFDGLYRGCQNNPICSNLGLCAVCWAHFMYHHELWPTSVGHPFSFLNSSWGLTGRKHYQKITITISRFDLQNFTISGYFPHILFYTCLSPYFLLVGLLFEYVALFQSSELVKV